jgi:predicted aspartyl protease
MDLGQAEVRLEGQQLTTLVGFGEDGTRPLLGAYTLEGFGLVPDPVGRRLVPVEGLLM